MQSKECSFFYLNKEDSNDITITSCYKLTTFKISLIGFEVKQKWVTFFKFRSCALQKDSNLKIQTSKKSKCFTYNKFDIKTSFV